VAAGSLCSAGAALALAYTAPPLPPLPAPPPPLPPPTALQLLPRAAALALLFAPICLLLPLLLLSPSRVPRLRAAVLRCVPPRPPRARASRRLQAAHSHSLHRRLRVYQVGPVVARRPFGSPSLASRPRSATRPDLFPPDLCEALSELHAHVPPHGWGDTAAAVQRCFGAPLHTLFSRFDAAPVGSGSIAQVHRAALRAWPAAGEVAVKVRHPRVEERMRTDFALLCALGRLCDASPALAWLRVGETLAQFGHAVGAQVSLRSEGANLARLRNNFRAAPHVAASFPQPLPHLLPPAISDDVLVESFEPGRALDEAAREARAWAAAAAGARAAAAAARAPPPPPPPPPPTSLSARDAAHVVRAGIETYLHMLLVDNFVHADLHPGNILLRERQGRAPQLVLVDAGMVDTLSPPEAAAFVGLFSAMGAGDGRAAADALLACGEAQRAMEGPPEAAAAAAERHEAFRCACARLFDSHCRGFRSGADVGGVLRATLAAMRQHRVSLDGRAAAALVNLLCIESFAAALQPQASLLDGAEAHLRLYNALGERTFALLLKAASPALALARRVDEALRWGLPATLQDYVAIREGRLAVS